MIPAVARTEIIAGEWNLVGSRRRVELVDGHYAVEEVLVNELDATGQYIFGYEVFGYTNFAKLLIDHAVGEFRIGNHDSGGTELIWTYQYYPKTMFARPVLAAFVSQFWAPYMRKVISVISEAAPKSK